MKILLDECIDRKFARLLRGYGIRTVPQMGWASLKNGTLLRRAQAEFDAFITVDGSLAYQQPVTKFQIAIVVLRVKSNRMVHLSPLVPLILKLLPDCEPGHVYRLSVETDS